ncbi:hypothetical protein I7I51_02173 [Histoplasma capsulatum]|uniref:DUF7924 domain-containing protein n=1 Tax=Ajellomyces capsulatus TaxID=5037 RepID=A0A8A1M7E6_AJECA|nr:hypothetical protein I7I51_02173 [Histoplasma capsulatum]
MSFLIVTIHSRRASRCKKLLDIRVVWLHSNKQLDQILGSQAEDAIELTGRHHGDNLQHYYGNKFRVQRRGSPIEHWVDTSSWPFNPSLDNDILIPPFPNESASTVPHCFSSIQSLSGVSVASSESLCYQGPLDYRGICIYRNEPPEPLMQKAKQIITEEHDPSTTSSLLHGEAALQELSKLPRRLWNATEEEVFEELGNRLTPGRDHDHDHYHYDDTDDHRLHPTLTCSIKRQWTESVSVPLLPDFHTAPFLPDPKPDKAYGFSHDAFTHAQHAIIPTLTESAAACASLSASCSGAETEILSSPSPNLSGGYASPDAHLFFPFFAAEFASMATGGTHHTATEEASNAAAISLNSLLELHRRTVGTHQFDETQPWFFSLTMDQQIARLNVHWITVSGRSRARKAQQSQFHSHSHSHSQSQSQSQSPLQIQLRQQRHTTVATATSTSTSRLFNTELLSTYILSDTNSLRDLQRATWNILRYGRDVLLPKVRLLLDLCQHLPGERRSVSSSNQSERGLSRDSEVGSCRPNVVDGSAVEENGEGPEGQQQLQEQEYDQDQQDTWEGEAPDVFL